MEKYVQPHPLLLSNILAKIFSYLTEVELLPCVTVCHIWRSETHATLRKRITATISSVRLMKKFLARLESEPLKQITELTLKKMLIDLNPKEFSLLMSRISNSLRKLTIHTCLIHSMDPVHFLIRNAPYLTHITLDTLKTPPIGYEGWFRHSLLPIYGSTTPRKPLSFPGVKYFEYMNYDNAFDAAETRLVSVIEAFPKLETLFAKNLKVDDPTTYLNMRMPQLQCLFVQMGVRPMRRVNEQLIRVFEALKLKLRHIRFQNVSEIMRPSVLQDWIQSHSETLRNLELEQIMDIIEVSISCFPLKLPNLHYLAVDRNFVKNINHILDMKYFPQLNKLEFRFQGTSNWIKIFPKTIAVHENVRDLEISYIDCTCFQKLLYGLPNLKILVLNHGNDNLLRIVFKNLTQLKSFSCHAEVEQLNEMTTAGITGINPGEDLRTCPYIGDLKLLSSLHLSFSSTPNSSILYKGILDCPTLQNLILVGLKLSPKLKNEIKKRTGMNLFPLTKTYLRKCRVISESELQHPVYFFGHLRENPFTTASDSEWSDCE